MKASKPVIGLAGGIGAGKSTIAAEFARLGCLVLDSDEQAHEVLCQPDVMAELRTWLGPDVFDESGRPVRKRIAAKVFGHPEMVDRLTDMVHPRVHAMRRAAIARHADDPAVKAFVLDTPLLFEAGVDAECDAIVFIDAPLELRRGRVATTRGWSADELDRRQGHQMDLGDKRSRCGFVVSNAGSPEDLTRQVRVVLDAILATCQT